MKKGKTRRWLKWSAGILFVLSVVYAVLWWNSTLVENGVSTWHATMLFTDICFGIRPYDEVVRERGLTHTFDHAPGWTGNANGHILVDTYERSDGGYECVVAFISRYDNIWFKRWIHRWRLNRFFAGPPFQGEPPAEVPAATIGMTGPDEAFAPGDGVNVYAFSETQGWMTFLTFEPPDQENYFELRLIKARNDAVTDRDARARE